MGRCKEQSYQYIANLKQDEESKNIAHQMLVHPHVTVENMAAFVSDDPLQFITGQLLDGASGNPDNRILMPHASRKSINAFFFRE